MQPFQEEDDKRFLISTKRILGTGVTLTRAFRSVNMDADWIQFYDIQCDGRVVRLSQRNPKTYNYYLITDDEHGVDQKVLFKQNRDNMTRQWAYE